MINDSWVIYIPGRGPNKVPYLHIHVLDQDNSNWGVIPTVPYSVRRTIFDLIPLSRDCSLVLGPQR